MFISYFIWYTHKFIKYKRYEQNYSSKLCFFYFSRGIHPKMGLSGRCTASIVYRVLRDFPRRFSHIGVQYTILTYYSNIIPTDNLYVCFKWIYLPILYKMVLNVLDSFSTDKFSCESSKLEIHSFLLRKDLIRSNVARRR